MLVAGGVAGDAVGVHASFVGEGARADERLSGAKIHVSRFINVSRHLGQPGQASGPQHFVPVFQGQIGDDANQIDVAAALADAVDRSLHLGSALGHGRQGVGHGHVAIIVTMDAEGGFQDASDLSHGCCNLVRQRSPVRVAQNDDRCARLLGCT